MTKVNAKKVRPLSPHLQIYKPQITSVLSVFHRGTGVFLFIGLLFLFWFLTLVLVQMMGLGFLETNLLLISDNIIFKVFILGVAFSLYYHLLNGIRHLFWDIGLGFKISNVYKSGYMVIFGSLIMTMITAYYIFFYLRVHE